MAKKRTRAQKIRTARRQAQPIAASISVQPVETPVSPQDSFIRRDFLRTAVSTGIVLAVLLAVFVYTKNLF